MLSGSEAIFQLLTDQQQTQVTKERTFTQIDYLGYRKFLDIASHCM